MNMGAEALYLSYGIKLSAYLRGEVMRRKHYFEANGPWRAARTWEQAKVICDEVVREGRNLIALKEFMLPMRVARVVVKARVVVQ